MIHSTKLAGLSACSLISRWTRQSETWNTTSQRVRKVGMHGHHQEKQAITSSQSVQSLPLNYYPSTRLLSTVQTFLSPLQASLKATSSTTEISNSGDFSETSSRPSWLSHLLPNVPWKSLQAPTKGVMSHLGNLG